MIKRFPLLAAMTPIILAAASSAMAQAPYPPPMPNLLANPCEPYQGPWIYQGLLEQRAAACREQQARQQAQRNAEARRAQLEAQRAQLEAQRAQAEAEARQQALVAAQQAAEMAPGNICRKPGMAKMVMQAYNELDWPPYRNRVVIDIEHLVTLSNDEGSQILSCHGVFVHTDGIRLEGTMTFRPNVAGEMIFSWKQETWTPPVYVAPPSLPPTSAAPPVATTGYEQGRTDRLAWETWFSSLSGDYKEGARYWSGQRSLSHPGLCTSPIKDFEDGCKSAQVKLSSTDARRKSEPDYRAGWNSL
jgi:hypothetical protein